jgi:hypothetical protein
MRCLPFRLHEDLTRHANEDDEGTKALAPGLGKQHQKFENTGKPRRLSTNLAFASGGSETSRAEAATKTGAEPSAAPNMPNSLATLGIIGV